MSFKKYLIERLNPNDWKNNFIVLGDKYFIAVEVIAAENDGWRVEVGFSKNGMVVEDPKQIIKSDWKKTFEIASKEAKILAKKYNIKWEPKPYGDRSKFKDIE